MSTSAYPYVESLIDVTLAEQRVQHELTMRALHTTPDPAAMVRLTQRAFGYENRIGECRRALTRLADPGLIG